jgi:hypothetical protein
MVKPFNDFVSSIGSIGLVETPGSIIGWQTSGIAL